MWKSTKNVVPKAVKLSVITQRITPINFLTYSICRCRHEVFYLCHADWAQQGHVTYFFATEPSPHRPLRNHLVLVRKLLPYNRLVMNSIQAQPQSCKPKMNAHPQYNCLTQAFPDCWECSNKWKHPGGRALACARGNTYHSVHLTQLFLRILHAPQLVIVSWQQ